MLMSEYAIRSDNRSTLSLRKFSGLKFSYSS